MEAVQQSDLTLTAADIRHRREFASFASNDSMSGVRERMDRIYVKWNKWNKEFFGGIMVEPYILLTDMAGATSMGDFDAVSGFGGKSQIRLRQSILEGTYPLVANGNKDPEGLFRVVEDVLLRMMVHQYAHEVLGKPEVSFHGHGPVFRDECNRIGAILGLDRVRNSKRRGPDANLPSCANWPHNVRPNLAKYYRGAWPTPTLEQLEFLDSTPDGVLETVNPWGKGDSNTSASKGMPAVSQAEWHVLLSECPKLSIEARSVIQKLAEMHQIPAAA